MILRVYAACFFRPPLPVIIIATANVGNLRAPPARPIRKLEPSSFAGSDKRDHWSGLGQPLIDGQMMRCDVTASVDI